MPTPLSGAKTYKVTVEDCIAIDMVMLRRKDMLLDFMDHRLHQKWYLRDKLIGDLFLNIAFTGDIAYPTLSIEGTCFGKHVRQSLRLVSKSMRFGGRKWYVVCPGTMRLCRKLILPPGGKAFASRKAWGLAYRSQNIDAVARANRAAEALRMRSETLPRRTRQHTRQALERRLEAKEAFLERVEGHCMQDLSNGRRMSVRRAAKLAAMERRRRSALSF